MGRKKGGAVRAEFIPQPPRRKMRTRKFVPIKETWWQVYCHWCGREFCAKRSDAKYHSHACRQAAYIQRQKDRIALIEMQAGGEGIFDSPLYGA